MTGRHAGAGSVDLLEGPHAPEICDTMFPRLLLLATLLASALLPASGHAAAHGFSPGAPGIGDPYYPLDGNGGYDVAHYTLDVRYEPESDRLSGRATLRARATQSLSRFDLDLHGLEVSAIQVNGRPAAWAREADELVITPARGLRAGTDFTTVVEYAGVPETLQEAGTSGFIHTPDGAVVAGEPHVAATWFPANDHPSDQATYTLRISVPDGLQAVANGALVARSSHAGWTTWVWEATAPMASYLVGLAIGHYQLSSRVQDGIAYWDAVDVAAVDQSALVPSSGSRFLLSLTAEPAYKRLARVLSIPAQGAELSFSVIRRTEDQWDYFFVEAHTEGADDWTTLPDEDGFATPDTGFTCPRWQRFHPFLSHYQTPPAGDGEGCTATGTTGQWWAATGSSAGAERWTIDLSAWAGKNVELMLSYASDDFNQLEGVFIDDISVSTGAGSTSFEQDGDPLDGWRVAGPPDGSAENANDWTVGSELDVPASLGEVASASLARQPEMLAFLSSRFGPYPFETAGAIVSSVPLAFAIETETRPIYPAGFFAEPAAGEITVVHELAHQWFGDSLSVASWSNIWLNEGFATYAEWLWQEDQGLGTAQESFDALLLARPADDPFWTVAIGDPGADLLFDEAVYLRGAMTLQALRNAVGDDRFFAILQCWASSQAGEAVTTQAFIDVAEASSGADLGELFDAWLFQPSKPLPDPVSEAPSDAVSGG